MLISVIRGQNRIMRTFISNIILPLPVLWVFMLLAFIQYIRKKKTSSRIFVVLSVLWLLVISTPFVTDLLVRNLENRYAVFSPEYLQNKKGPVNILVLGGGCTDDKRLPANSQLEAGSIARLSEGIRIHRLFPGSTLITSGYAGTSNDTPHAIVAAKAAILLGVDPASIKRQETPENTWQEALTYKQMFGDSATLVLVTSAIHIPRTMYLFRKAGLKPIAAPADFMVKNEKRKSMQYWFPSAGYIKEMEDAVHEYVGLAWYKVRLVTVKQPG